MPIVDLPILVANVDTLLGAGHTDIEIHASTDEGNSYEEITASTATAAILTSDDASTTFQIAGYTLVLKVDGGTEESVVFSSTPPNWTPAQVRDEINAVVAGLAAVSGSAVVLTSGTTGRASSIEIVSGGTPLGWDAETLVYGKDARVTLVSATYSYTYQDASGSTEYRYKWRTSADGANPISSFSLPIYGSEPPLIAGANLSVAQATFVDVQGKPIRTKIIVGVVNTPQSLSGYIVGIQTPLVFETDDSGFVQFTLVRGAKVRVAFEGTPFVKEITIPNAATFNLLTELGNAPDAFTVQQAPTALGRRVL